MAKRQPQSGMEIVTEANAIADQMDTLKIKLVNGATSKALRDKAADAKARIELITQTAMQLSRDVDKKNAVLKELLDLRKMVRAGAAGQYGDNSDEYAGVGGTKASDRKKRAAKPKAAS